MEAKHRTLGAALLAAASLFCAPAANAAEAETTLPAIEHRLLLPPPESGIAPTDLGAGLTEKFRAIDPKLGALEPAFDNKVQVIDTNKCQFRFEQITDQFHLNANANYFLASGTVSTSEDKRHMVYRAYCTTKVVRLAFETGAKPRGPASLTPVAIHYGWSIDVALSGSASDFTAGVAARLMQVGGELATQQKNYHLKVNQVTRGLSPKEAKSVHLVTSANDVLEYYQQAPEPAPILVEYMLTKSIVTQAIDWQQEEDGIPDGHYILHIRNLEISKMKIVRGRAKKWDGFGAGGPDIRLSVLLPGATKPARQELCKDSYVCTLSVPLEVRGKTPVRIVVVEQDVSDDDPVGIIDIPDLRALGKPDQIVDYPVTEPQIVQLMLRLEAKRP